MWLGRGDGTRVPKIQYESTHLELLIERQGKGKNSTEILDRYPRCTIAAHSRVRESCQRGTKSKRISEGKFMNTGYTNWLGRAVVLSVEVGDIKVPLRGKLLKENRETVRMRIGEGWDVDIYKTMILDVQEDLMGMISA